MSLRDFMLRPGLRLRGWVPKPSLWPPTPDGGAIGQTHRGGRGDSTPGGRDGRGGAEAGPPGARGAGSLRLGAGLGPRTCAQAQPSRKSRAAGGWSGRCHPLPERGTPRLPGLEPQGCAAAKEGRSLPPRLALLLHRLAPPLPGRVSDLAPPLPGRCGGGGGGGGVVSRTPDLSASRPYSPTACRSAQPLAAGLSIPTHIRGRSTPPGLCFAGVPVWSVVPLTHIPVRSRGPLFGGAVPTQQPMAPRVPPSLLSSPAPKTPGLCLAMAPPRHPT